MHATSKRLIALCAEQLPLCAPWLVACCCTLHRRSNAATPPLYRAEYRGADQAIQAERYHPPGVLCKQCPACLPRALSMARLAACHCMRGPLRCTLSHCRAVCCPCT